MLPIQMVVNDPEWQALRASLVGTWKTSSVENIHRLEVYLGAGPDGQLRGTDPLRVRRVLNYLTGSAFRIGIISHPEVNRLLARVRTLPRV